MKKNNGKTPKVEVLVPRDSRLYAINRLADGMATLASALSASTATQVNVSYCTFRDIKKGPALNIRTVEDTEYDAKQYLDKKEV
jgi:hypothetical protein